MADFASNPQIFKYSVMKYNMISNKLLGIPVFLIALFCSVSLLAQPGGKYSSSDKKAVDSFRKGFSAYLAKDLKNAEKNVQKAISRDPNFWEAHMLMGDIRNDKKDVDRATESYMKAYSLSPKFANKGALYSALAEKGRANFKKAEEYASLYKRQLEDPRLISDANDLLMRCRVGADIMDNPKPFKPINLGPEINTKNAEYGPTISTDEQLIIFTRLEPTARRSCPTPDGRLEDFYFSELKDGAWKTAQNMGPPLNTDCNEGAQSISPDGRYLFYAAVGRKEAMSEASDIYVAEKMGDRWINPKNIGAPVNTRSWESQPFIASDGKTLYFVSTMPGGQGGADIWKTEKMADGKWTRPVNLGPDINTPGDEFSPFIHPDNQTLYFVSDFHPGVGGFDIFYSRKGTDGKFGKPVNLGYPINTLGDERSLVISADGKTGYYASNALEGFGDFDLYKFELYQDARPVPVTYMKGRVTDAYTAASLEARFELIDLESGEVIIQSFSDKISGEFLVAIPVNRNYALNVSRNGYLFHSENFELKEVKDRVEPYRKNVKLTPVNTGQSVVLKNIFFETGSAQLKNESRVELDKLVELLQKNPTMKIEISGHTDNVGSKESNMKLSDERAKSVVNYLVKAGINSSRLTFKGYGDTQPVDDNNTAEGRANNRRTEFKVTEI